MSEIQRKQTTSTSLDNQPDAHQVCETVVAALIARHRWTLLSTEELMDRTMGSLDGTWSPEELKQLALRCYADSLYAACRQNEDLGRRECGYTDLFHYLYQVAYRRWPDLAEEATQRALLLIYEQIDRCRMPASFLIFALYKLRHAFQQERRARGICQSVDLCSLSTTEADPMASYALTSREYQEALLDALRHLPDGRMAKVILMRFFAGLHDDEIGACLGITVNHVRVLRCRGLERLQGDQHLRDIVEEDGWLAHQVLA
jgi:RNA polymerase sigma factor (sigma-70 family)